MYKKSTSKNGVWRGRFTWGFIGFLQTPRMDNLGISDMTEIDFLQKLISFKKSGKTLWLTLKHNQISEISFERYYKTRWLTLKHNQISEIKGLKNLPDLQYLFLQHNQITEIKESINLPNLGDLYLQHNQITEIKGLENLPKLGELDLHYNQITEIKGLEKLTRLGILSLQNNQITEIKGLETLTELMTLSLQNNQIKEIKGLHNLEELSGLNLSNNRIAKIKNLNSLHELKWLDLSNNQISEIEGLENLQHLVYLNLKNNPIPKTLIDDLGGLHEDGSVKEPSNYVVYCRRNLFFEESAISKLTKLLKISNRFRLDMMVDLLNIDKYLLKNKLLKLSKEFGFVIDGDYVIINNDTISKFIDALDKQFIEWSRKEETKTGKQI